MGCTGSKPHLLLSSSLNQNTNGGPIASPQKGFILFNSKTLAYLRAHENATKLALIKRCRQKLCNDTGANATGAASNGQAQQQQPPLNKTSSLLNSAKRTLLSGSSSAHTHPTSPKSATLNGVSPHDAKDPAIEQAVQYVMNYALSDFDIESFQRSNHLSMKQIRKDIMKKSMTNDANSMPPFYKVALNTAIDEFGSYVQEHFIAINEFNPTNNETRKTSTTAGSNHNQETNSRSLREDIEPDETSSPSVTTTLTSEEQDAALKLKEALEVARQNFYKGKVSLVCLSKHGGGYVVKEMQQQSSPQQQQQQSDPNRSLNNSANSATELPSANGAQTPRINVEDVDAATIDSVVVRDDQRGNDHKSVSNISVKSINLEGSIMSRSYLDEFVALKESSNLSTQIRGTLEAIVRYSTRPNDLDVDLELDARELTALTSQLLKSTQTTDLLKQLDEHDYAHVVDGKLVEGILNLDYVVDEFRGYLQLVEVQYTKCEKYAQNLKSLAEMSKAVEKLDKSIAELPAKLFISKGLPPPIEVNRTTTSRVQQANPIAQTPSITEPTTTTTMPKVAKSQTPNFTNFTGMSTAAESSIVTTSSSTPLDAESDESCSSSSATAATPAMTTSQVTSQTHSMPAAAPIDIKKEIAFSILNVGEVLAKTIDYYSLPNTPNKGGPGGEELKELIKISEAQAAHERKMALAAQNQLNHHQHSNHNHHHHHHSHNHQHQKPLEVNVTDVVVVPPTPTATLGESGIVVDLNKESTTLATVVTTTTSSSSALSSPTISTTSSLSASGSGSISPTNNNSDEANTRNNVDESNKMSQKDKEPEDLIEAKAIQNDIAFLVEEMSNANLNGAAMNNYLDEYERYQQQQQQQDEQGQKVSSSSSDLMMTNSNSNNTNLKDDDDDESNMLVQQFISNIIESASKRLSDCEVEIEIEQEKQLSTPAVEVVFRGNGAGVVVNNGNNENGNKRMSLDEELLYQLEDVDKKVKYMNETCSENEDDDDEDEFNGHDDDFDGGNDIDDERLFHPTAPRRPAEIKSNVRHQNLNNVVNRRQINLHDEIKQISNVIQDLVQTINVGQPESPTATMVTSPLSQDERKSSLNGSRKSTTSTSSIPVLRQRVLTKQKAEEVHSENNGNHQTFKTTSASTTIESYVEFASAQSTLDTSVTPQSPPQSHQHQQPQSPLSHSGNTSSSSNKFRSKLPIKK